MYKRRFKMNKTTTYKMFSRGATYVSPSSFHYLTLFIGKKMNDKKAM